MNAGYTATSVLGIEMRCAQSTGREFPARTIFRYVRRIPNSAITHVSASPPFHPGRPDFSALSTLAFPVRPSPECRSLSAEPHTPLAIQVYPTARHIRLLPVKLAQSPELGPKNIKSSLVIIVRIHSFGIHDSIFAFLPTP